MPKIQPNRAKQICNEQKIKISLKRLPNVSSFEHVDEARFNMFTKKMWKSINEHNSGYTIIFVPSYFDFIKLRTYLKNEGANVSFISEYSEKKSCQRARHYYESGQRKTLMITERAIIF